MRPWWEQWPGRLEWELTELEKAGFTIQEDPAAREHGRIVLNTSCDVEGTRVELKLAFPELYPFFSFGATAPGLALPHHQNPFTRELCLLGIDSGQWSPSLSAAELLRKQLPVLLDSTREDYRPDPRRELLDAEPITAYMQDDPPGSWVAVGDWSLPPAPTSGTLTIGVDHAWPFRGAVLEVRGTLGGVIARAEPGLVELYRTQRIQGRWQRLDRRPESLRPLDLLRMLTERDPRLATPQWRQPFRDFHIDIVGGVFPDELRVGEQSDNWFFVARRTETREGGKLWSMRAYLLRPGRESRADFAARVPELCAMGEKAIAVVGLGSLGSTAALEFARAGARRLHLADRDQLEMGNTVRWALGREYVGLSKAYALGRYLRKNYPLTEVKEFWINLGSPIWDPRAPSTNIILDSILEGVDLVLDASAQVSMSHVLSTLCWERKIPHVWVTTTPGAWGGIVGRAMPALTDGCWLCTKFRLRDETIQAPAVGPDDGVQPAGCLTATFTGAAMDIHPIACAAVRLAVATLSRGVAGGYPDSAWDIGVVNLRTPEGHAVPPTWTTYQAFRHPDCGHA